VCVCVCVVRVRVKCASAHARMSPLTSEEALTTLPSCAPFLPSPQLPPRSRPSWVAQPQPLLVLRWAWREWAAGAALSYRRLGQFEERTLSCVWQCRLPCPLTKGTFLALWRSSLCCFCGTAVTLHPAPVLTQ